jgi:DNA-binding transcriptional ArsR family regulator
MVELSRNEAALDHIFHALSDGTRRRILRSVSQGAQPVTELAKPFAMSLAAVSKHLDVLERAGLVRRERRGNCRMVQLEATRLRPAQEWLAYYEAFWSEGLDRLQTLLEEPNQGGER